jgi:radical SAM superfamily enzyme YgiQ (UPF0313 family)
MNAKQILNAGPANKPDSVSYCPQVILLSLNWTRDKDPRFPLGHASLLAALQAAGREVESLVFSVNTDLRVEDVAVAILKIANRDPKQPVVLGIGAYVWGEAALQNLLPLLRQRGFAGRIVLGGPQVSFMESDFETTYPQADIFVRGNGERALLAITSTPGPVTIPGVHYAGSERPVSTAKADIDDLPSPWLRHDWGKEPLKFVRMETIRGCPFSCSFCQHRAPDKGARIVELPESRVMREIALFCEQGVESIAVLDPIFNASPRSVGFLKAFVERGYQGKLSLQCRAELITDDFLAAASRLNVTLEFGLQTIHPSESDAVNRRNKIDKVDEALRKVRALGIGHEVSLIFGLPTQTLNSFRDTLDWCLRRQVPVIKAFPLMLLRGTQLAADASRWSLRESAHAIPFVISSSTFTEKDWTEMNALSMALKATEGRHPASIGQLHCSHEAGSIYRWTPSLAGRDV